jgi:hypothetical protein
MAHPFMVGASPLVDHLDTVKRLEDGGSAAIVLHSLFEEQISMAKSGRIHHMDPFEKQFADALSGFPLPERYALAPHEYLEHLHRVKAAVQIPVIGASPRMLHAAAAYGVFGTVGFLAQMVVAMEVRLLPLSAWYWAYARSEFRVAPVSPLMMRDRTLQTIVFLGWTFAVPALAVGFALESSLWTAGGAWSLLAAVVTGALDNVFVLLHVTRQHPQRDQAEHDQIREQPRRQRRRAGEDLLGRV